MGLLAISLIDREIKVYKVKQNGAKVSFIEHLSFHAKFIITCLCIERYVSNSRPILCMGSKSGEIQIFYLDEPFTNPLTGKPDFDGRVREKQMDCSPFSFFPQPASKGLVATVSKRGNEENELNETTRSLNDATIMEETSNYSENSENDQQAEEKGANKKNAQNYKQGVVKKKENEITELRYIRDIGLIASAFNGTIKFFDSFNFAEQWSTANKQRKENQHTNITVFDVSVKLGIMATGGAEGRIILIDPYALGIIKGINAHFSEIISLFIFEEQQQIITVGMDRTIGLWESSRLEKIQVIKDIGDAIHAPKFTSASFDQGSGTLFIGCQQISVWQAQTDQKVEINALQVQTLSKQILKERRMLDWQDPSYDPQSASYQLKKKKDTDARTGKVLVTTASTLVNVLINLTDTTNFLITIDSENLLRGWNVEQSMTTLSYRLPVQSRVTAAAIDDTSKFLAVGTTTGEAKVVNLKSGGVLYTLTSCNTEIASMRFISGQTEFWLFGACWGGKLMMWT